MNEKEVVKKTSEGFSCCTPGASCCENHDTNSLPESGEINEKYMPKLRDTEKLNVDIFVPLEACSCEWSNFMNLVFAALTPYIKYIDHKTKSIQSEEARKLNIRSKCVVVDGTKKFITSFALKKQLPNLLRERELI